MNELTNSQCCWFDHSSSFSIIISKVGRHNENGYDDNHIDEVDETSSILPKVVVSKRSIKYGITHTTKLSHVPRSVAIKVNIANSISLPFLFFSNHDRIYISFFDS